MKVTQARRRKRYMVEKHKNHAIKTSKLTREGRIYEHTRGIAKLLISETRVII